ncbi:MAG: hypothetical protein HYX21_02645 [Candidatus Yanofskybacteria bacterium]|nr:hypothetical protein [Candidatus Yanofskybacteria bacterium]
MTEEQVSLPTGPVFEAGPGWGKKVSSWFKRNFGKRILPFVAAVVLLIGIASAFSRPSKTVNTENKPLTANFLEVSVEKGDGIIALSRKALNKYLEEFPEIKLKPEQKLYIDNFFKSKMDGKFFVLGEKAQFTKADIEQAVRESLALSESKLEKFRQYLK